MVVEILRTKGIRGILHSLTAERRKKQLQLIFEEYESTLLARIDPWRFKISINKDVPTPFWFENEDDTYKETMFARQKASDTSMYTPGVS